MTKAPRKSQSKHQNSAKSELCTGTIAIESNVSSNGTFHRTLYRSNHDIFHFALKLRNHLEPHIKDRRWRDLKVYKNCFLHSEAVKWAIEFIDESKLHAGSDIEEQAVNCLNEVLLAGYISHVTNDHRFRVGETKTLYFRFDDSLLRADEKQFQEGNSVNFELVMMEEISTLKSTVDRFDETIESLNQALNEANSKITYLESVIILIEFVLRFFMITALFLAIYMGIDSRKQFPFLHHFLFVIPLTVFCWNSMDRAEHGNFITRQIGMIIEFIKSRQCILKEDRESDSEYSDIEDDRSISSSVALTREAYVSAGKSADTIQMREADNIPEPSSWIYRPVIISVNTAAAPDLEVSSTSGICPLGVPFKFESDLFDGQCLIRLKDIRSNDLDGDEAYFKGRARKFQAVVQGKFKEPLNVSDVLTGHEFVRPIKNLPPHWILRTASTFIQKLAPGAEIDMTSTQPKAMAILAATSQSVTADRPGNEPEITSLNFPEDLSILGGYFKERKVSSSKRKNLLANPRRAKKYFFDTESVYTFDFYQSILDVKTYSLDLGFTKINLARRLDGQPIQILSKTKNGRYLWSFQVWHEKLLKNRSEKVSKSQ